MCFCFLECICSSEHGSFQPFVQSSAQCSVTQAGTKARLVDVYLQFKAGAVFALGQIRQVCGFAPPGV